LLTENDSEIFDSSVCNLQGNLSVVSFLFL